MVTQSQHVGLHCFMLVLQVYSHIQFMCTSHTKTSLKPQAMNILTIFTSWLQLLSILYSAMKTSLLALSLILSLVMFCCLPSSSSLHVPDYHEEMSQTQDRSIFSLPRRLLLHSQPDSASTTTDIKNLHGKKASMESGIEASLRTKPPSRSNPTQNQLQSLGRRMKLTVVIDLNEQGGENKMLVISFCS